MTKRGLLIHEGRCEWKDQFKVEKIIVHKGNLSKRKYLIKWEDYPASENSWEPAASILDQQLIADFKRQGKAPARAASAVTKPR